MADKHSQEHSEYNTYSDFLSEAITIPLFNYDKRKEDNQLNLLSLFSGCGGMDIGFEGGFICHRKSIPVKDRKSVV